MRLAGSASASNQTSDRTDCDLHDLVPTQEDSKRRVHLLAGSTMVIIAVPEEICGKPGESALARTAEM
jgi:hypothetical protein